MDYNFFKNIQEKVSVKKLNKRERLFFLGVILTISIFFVDRILFRTAMRMVNDLDEQIERQELLYRNDAVLASNKERILSHLQKYQKYLELPESAKEDSLAGIFSYLESLARKNNITIVDIKPKKDRQERKYVFYYPIEMEIEAGTDSLLDFFYELNEGDFIIDVGKAFLKPKNDLVQVTVEVDAIIFK